MLKTEKENEDETKEDMTKKDKIKENENKKEIVKHFIDTGEEIIKSIFQFFKKTKKNNDINKNNSESEFIDSKNDELDELKKKIEELMQEKKDQEEKEKEPNQNEADNINFWNENKNKNKIVELILNEINYIDLIKKCFETYFEEFKKNILENIAKILNDELKSKQIIKEMHHSIFEKIKSDIPEINFLNFIICGFSGAGKSTIINVILKEDLAREGNDIHSETQQFKLYSNPYKVPGIIIYDTIGVDPTNTQRNLSEIKKMIEDTFDKNLKVPHKSLHGIFYCINNGNDANRIEEAEIKFIKDLNKSNGDCDILTIIFTFSLNENTENRIKQLKADLNNDNIEIIDILAKDYTLKIGNQSKTIPAFGLDKLIASIKKNAKKIVIANLKQMAKNKIKNKFIETTVTKYDDIKKKVKNQEFESSFAEECKVILDNLIGNLELNFESLEKIVSDSEEKLKSDVKEKFIEETKRNELYKLYEEFENLNNNYEGQIKDSLMNESFMGNLNNYYDTKVTKDIHKLILENASLLFIEKSKDLFSEIISDNVKDEEVEDIANSTLDTILEKIIKNKK